jgi:hypothetical protein
MKYDDNLIKIVLDNMELVEESNNILISIEESILSSLFNYIKNLNEKNKIFEIGTYDTEKQEMYFLKKKWYNSDNDIELAYFSFECDETKNSWPIVLTGQSPDSVAGFYYYISYNEFGLNRREWRNFLQKEYNLYHDFLKNGFSINKSGDSIIKTFILEKECLSLSYPNFNDCFTPIYKAYHDIINNIVLFDNILKDIKKYRG